MTATIRHTLLAIATILIIAACADHDESFGRATQRPIDVKCDIAQQQFTRASDNSFAQGDKIGVFVVNYQNGQPQPLLPNGNHADNVAFTYNQTTGKWETSQPLYWKDEQTTVDAYGYYPYDAQMSSVEAYSFSVVTDQSITKNYEASDFLWAKADGAQPSTGVISLIHHHMMAGIKVTLVEGVGFDPGEWAQLKKSLLIENTVPHATISIADGKVTATGSEIGTITPMTISGDANTGYSFRAIIVPQTMAASVPLLAITIDGKSYHYTRNEVTDYVAGKIHQFTIMVSKTLEEGDYELSLVTEAITQWEDDGLTHAGEAREYIVVDIKDDELLEDVLQRMNINPQEIVNLKLTGTMSGNGISGGTWSIPNFYFIRDNMPSLEALNMKELNIVNSSVRMVAPGESFISWRNILYGEKQKSNSDKNTIPESAFAGMHHLKYVVLPDNLEAIGARAFYGTGLRGSLILPESVKYIDWECFNSEAGPDWLPYTKYSALTGDLYLPPGIEYIGDRAFALCDFDCELRLPERMTYLGDMAFYNCQFLHGQIRIPEGLTSVNGSWEGTAVTGIAVVPGSVKTVSGIGGHISGVIFSEGVEDVRYIAGRGWDDHWDTWQTLTKDIYLPATVKSMGRGIFAYSKIQHVNIPSGVSIIPEDAFANSSLSDTLTLPASVQLIQGGAFSNCYSISCVRCLNPEPPILTSNAFDGVEKGDVPLIVPVGSVEAYRNAEGWKEFKRITPYSGFVCRPMQTKVLNLAQERTIVLNADDSWTVTSCPQWVHLSQMSGEKKTELTVTIDELPHGHSSRTGNVVFLLAHNDETGQPINTTLEVSQYDYAYDENQQLTLQQATKGQRGGIDIMFVGDGYDAEDISNGTYLDDVKQRMEYFFGIEPYKTYRNYFNVHAAISLSEESGIQTLNTWCETKFHTTYKGGKQRLETFPEEVMTYVLEDISSGAVTPENINRSLVICLLNSDEYEGVTNIYESGAAVAFCPRSSRSYPYDSRGIIQHEAGGHGFGKLADEYIYHDTWIQVCTCQCCEHLKPTLSRIGLLTWQSLGFYRNVSAKGRYNTIEWSHLIFDHRYSDIADIYEGAYFHQHGVYRSEVNSCMNNNVAYYNTWSRQLIVERIMEAAGETFDYEAFVRNDSRESGDKFTTRMSDDGTAMPSPAYSSHHHPTLLHGSPLDYIIKNNK
ncbi:MAG: fimbrillin family protein [Prevotella sp.]|nr:fimbrillin family protein [Prevotella sp.]